LGRASLYPVTTDVCYQRYNRAALTRLFSAKDKAINDTENREIRVLDSASNVELIIPFDDTKRRL
jgi:hypothetical protein